MKTKFNLDRDKLNSDYIQNKQDYKKVLEGYQTLKPPLWKNPWFYGPIGLASLAVILVITFQSQVNAYGNNATLKTTSNSSFPEDTPCIQAPLTDKNIDFQIIDVLPEKGLNIKLESGTNISIPANSLQSEKGESVQIKIREFQDKSSAFIAGIPMDYGKNSAFESAGMIEIRSEKDGKSVSLDPEKPMNVDLALYQSPESFQFWKLNEKDKEWLETPCKMTAYQPRSKADKLKLVETKLIDKKNKIEICEKQIIDLSIITPSNNANKDLIPETNARKLVIDFDTKDFPELKGYKDIEFEYVLPTNRSEANLKEYSKKYHYVQTQIWNGMDIKKQQDYYIATFSNDKENYSLPIRPVLKGKSLAEMQAKMADASIEKSEVLTKIKTEKKTYEKEVADLKKQQEKLASELRSQLQTSTEQYNKNMEQRSLDNRSQALATSAAIQQGTASFRTTSFGVFNCDKPVPYPPRMPIFLAFSTDEGAQIRAENAFVFDIKKNTRYSFGGYYQHKVEELGWFDHESTLVVIDDKGNLYYRTNANESEKNKGSLVLNRLNQKDVTLDNIQSIIRETPLAV